MTGAPAAAMARAPRYIYIYIYIYGFVSLAIRHAIRTGETHTAQSVTIETHDGCVCVGDAFLSLPSLSTLQTLSSSPPNSTPAAESVSHQIKAIHPLWVVSEFHYTAWHSPTFHLTAVAWRGRRTARAQLWREACKIRVKGMNGIIKGWVSVWLLGQTREWALCLNENEFEKNAKKHTLFSSCSSKNSNKIAPILDLAKR